MSNFGDLSKNTESLLGFKRVTMGKMQARKEFLPLVDSLTTQCSAVEITDHDVPAAVLLSYQNYLMMAAKLAMHASADIAPKGSLIGSVKILVDDLESGNAEISGLFHAAIENSAKSL
jgi:PHD/YefM family antitoxin component YafN of YafNO toxin-antitoxin module